MAALNQYHHPVVVSMISSSENQPTLLKENMNVAHCLVHSPLVSSPFQSLPDPIQLVSSPFNLCKSVKHRHAMVVVGYKKDSAKDGVGCFYVKNSWGNGTWAHRAPGVSTTGGNAKIPFAYVDEFAEHA